MSNAFFDMPLTLDDNFNMNLNTSTGPNDSPQSGVSNINSPTGSSAHKPVAQRPSGGNRKGNSAERRATHNAIERARRESLNGRFLQLAASLPTIADVRRPSKSLIVNKSLDFVSESLNRETMYRLKIDGLRSENDKLRDQLNEFRRQARLEPLPAVKADDLPKPLSEMSNKKRSSSMFGVNAATFDLNDLDDEDGPMAPGSEGGESRTSPMPLNVGPDALAGVKGSVATGVPAVFGSMQPPQFSQHADLMQVPTGLAPGQASPTTSIHSEDLNSADRAGMVASGNWASSFDVKNYTSATSAASLSAQNVNPTYADFVFSSPSNVMAGASAGSNSFQQFVAASQPGAHGLMHAVNPLAQAHGFSFDPYAHMRSQPQHQQQPQYSQFSGSFDPNQAPHTPHHHHPQQQHFFDAAPLQTAQFMAAV